MIGPIKPFCGIGERETVAAMKASLGPLSGYLAGNWRGGYYVQALEAAWCEIFNVDHAIACNSATSGLLAAAFAVGLGPDDVFVCPAMTMSATAAAPMFTGAKPFFRDVSSADFGLSPSAMPDNTKAIFSTNLFGHPAPLGRNQWDQDCGVHLIEDNAQSPFAMAHGRHVGTMGTIGVWSLNVHKPIQCGEGGVVTTDDELIEMAIRDFINHGEIGGELGLNLRMPEVCAAIALEQLGRGQAIVDERVEQAEVILKAIGDIPGLFPPMVHPGCTHVYYTIPFLVDRTIDRTAFCAALHEQGVPIVEGYRDPLYRHAPFKAFARPCPIAEDLHDRRLFYFENCAWDPNLKQMLQIGDAFKWAAEKVL